MKGPPKEPLTLEQQTQINSLSAGGWSVNKISKHIGRSRNCVRNHLAKPEVQRTVNDEKKELAEIFREKSRAVVTSIDAADIGAASLQQKAVSSGILLDKSLLLTGDATVNMDIRVLVDIGAALRQRTEKNQELIWRESHARLVPQAKDCIVANCPIHSLKPAVSG